MKSIRSGSGVLLVLIVFLLLAVPAWAATPQATAGWEFHSLALKSDGTLWAWGNNAYGQLGISNTTHKTSPVQVGTATDWDSIVAGSRHTLALKSDGTLWAWGDNSQGQLGIGNTTSKTSPVQVGTATDWVSVAAGWYHHVAIKSDGTLWAWGWNPYGQLGIGNTDNKTSPVQVGTATDWVSVTAGQGHTVAMKSDGTLWAWGVNNDGELGIGNYTGPENYSGIFGSKTPVQAGTDTDWVSIEAGRTHTVALKSDGTLWVWGENYLGDLGIGNITGPETCKLGQPCATSPVQVGTATNWGSGSAGAYFTLSPMLDGTLWAWGWNSYGQLGIGNGTGPETCGSSACSTSPVQVSTDTAWDSVSAGYYHTIAVKLDGTLWAWGDNFYGQLGIGNTTDKYAPVEVMALADAYTLTMNTEGGTGLGNVVSDPPGINCGDGTPDDCTQDYADGTNIELTATPDADSTFIGWSGAGSGCVSGSTNPCSFDITYNTSSTATFNLTGTHTITASVNNSTMGSISPSGSVPVYEGEDQTFTITPNAGYYVDDVIVDSSSVGATGSYAFTNVTAAHSIEAQFYANPAEYEAIVNPGDVDGDGKDDIAVLITTDAGGKYASIKNATSGSWVGNVHFGSDYTTLALTTMPDMDGDGLMEFAFLGENTSSGAIVAHVISADDDYIRGTWFDKNYDFREFITIPDTNSNGYDDHVYLGVHNTNGQLVAQIADAYTGSYIRGIWYNKDYDVKGMAFSNTIAGNTPELSVLGVHNTNGQLVAQIYNAASGTSIRNKWFNKDYAPQPNGYVDLSDADGDGSYELETLGINNGIVLSQIYNADGGHVRSVYWDSSHTYTPVDLAVMANIANIAGYPSNSEELALLEEKEGSVQVEVRDAVSGVLINSVSIDSNYTPLGVVAVSDQNHDQEPTGGTTDIAVLGRHKTTGARRVFVKDVITGTTIKEIDFPAY